ncbi:glycosyl hydrolase [Aciduricibacillus chroicocephali]|uniref:Glycosyl hydrolase n=1 Tax=Aciduricibacillus chroicocephali TaxID=3054939 RepID=A0ABY9KV08_9BACI|nr:glycosyl hydrolase [Bacillaceae bacterium 44XB]
MRKLFASLLAATLLLQAAPVMAQKDMTSATERFIANHMQNPNGTLATYLIDRPSTDPTYVAGHEALSESLGLEMVYLFEKKDAIAFQKQYDILKQYYLAPNGLVRWKLNADGTSSVTTNALIDDWRIMTVLFKAGEYFGNAAYTETAKQMAKALAEKNMRNGYFTDFHDSQYNISNNTLSLFYIDPEALQYMLKYNVISKKTLNRTIGVLNSVPSDGVFFAKNFNVDTATYQNDAQVHMIEQIYIAHFRKLNGKNSPGFYDFVKQEFNRNGRLYGQYDRASRQPAVNFESNAVYGMLIQYALEMNDPDFARRVYDRMHEYEVSDPQSPYYGGYVVETPDGSDTHIFDNLFPLLAKQQLERLAN